MIINEKEILELVKKNSQPSEKDVLRVIDAGRAKKGLSIEDAALLANVGDPELISEIFSAAAKIKDEIYGERLVLFAPLYISDHCVNDCAYCNFHEQNREMKRRTLTAAEIARETKSLIDMGHKRILLETGEDPEHSSINHICDAIETIYSVKSGRCNIRRINVNIAATTTEDYRRLKTARIGTYQLFQETYHRKTYGEVHKGGPKADYDRQITAHARAFEAGIDDLGLGVLFGLYDWRFEVISLVAHAKWMEENLGVGPHTISVPRFCPAPTVDYTPKHPVSDADFLKLIAILRIAIPYTGMILSTRETPEMRRRAFALGISQASAASVTTPGGYSNQAVELPSYRAIELSSYQAANNDKRKTRDTDFSGQFETHDSRPLVEVVKSIVADGLIPSFCTACYRAGRTGEAFMNLAKPGDIHALCRPNALLTFAEYLEDYGDDDARKSGGIAIKKVLQKISDPSLREKTLAQLNSIRSGKRDVFF